MGIAFGSIIVGCGIHDDRMRVVAEVVVHVHLSRISEYNFKQMNNQIN